MAKKLVINCAGCDTRKAVKENYEQYESIMINADTVLTNSTGKAFLQALPITLNCANVQEILDDVDLKTVNGKAEIKSGDNVPDNPFILLVNGSLTIGANTEKYMQKCVSMTVNGSVHYPESMAAYLGKMNVYGSSSCYPDGAIILKSNTVIDRLFALRAKNSLYWSPRRMIMTDPDLDPQKLREEGCRFASKEVIIVESKVEAMIELISEDTDIIIVPDGTSVVLDDLTLDAKALRRYGDKLYVVGDAEVPLKGDCLDSLQYLVVKGDAVVPQQRRERFMEVLTDLESEVEILKPRGFRIQDRSSVKITRWMLDQHPDGLDIRDCIAVKLSPELTKEQIVNQLHIADCAMVRCSEDQEDAVAMISEDVGQITVNETDDNMGIGGTIKSALSGVIGSSDTKVINAADYVM